MSYDVVYIDPGSGSQLVGTGMSREDATALARDEARRRQVGRMFLAGSEPHGCGCAVLIVEQGRQLEPQAA